MPEPHFYELLRGAKGQFTIQVDNMIPHYNAYVFGNKIRMNSSRFYQLVWLTQGVFDEKLDRCFSQARKNIDDFIDSTVESKWEKIFYKTKRFEIIIDDKFSEKIKKIYQND